MSSFPRWRAACSALGLLAVLGTAVPAGAQTLADALARVYAENPQILAERARVRSLDEQVPQALANWRPTIEAQSSAGWQRSGIGQPIGNRTVNTAGEHQPRSLGVVASQPLYRGGRTVAQTSRAENIVLAARANLLATEQQVLQNAAIAYLDVVRDQAVAELNRNNVGVIERQLDAARDRFRVGDATRTDVSQAESRLSRAVADRALAEGQLEASRATFERFVGVAPGVLAQPTLTVALPAVLDEALQLALGAWSVQSAQFGEAAARDQIDVNRGEALPSAALRVTGQRNIEPSLTTNRQDTVSVIAQVTVPLYQGGAVSSRVKEATETAGQRQQEVDQARKQAIESTRRSWQSLVAARANVTARQAQIRAAETALDGVRQELASGSRTVLDLLNAEQELLDSRVSLVRGQRDELAAAFQLLAAIGRFGPDELRLPVDRYDPTTNYDEARGRWR